MSKPDTMTDAERHRQAAEATERHGKQHHEPKHDSSGGSAYGASVHHSGDRLEDSEASYFVRHRSALAAGVLIVLSIIFFTFVFGLFRL
jgi:hypothetical protein